MWGWEWNWLHESVDYTVKRTVSRDFLLLVFFSWISFPPAPEYPIRTISNFFENSRRYSQVKVHHRYQRHPTPAANLPLVSKTPAENFATSFACVVDTGGKFATGVNDTGGKFAASVVCRWYRWCTLTCEYLRKFSKKFETVLMGYSGLIGILGGLEETDSWKNQKSKISWHCPFHRPGRTTCPIHLWDTLWLYKQGRQACLCHAYFKPMKSMHVCRRMAYSRTGDTEQEGLAQCRNVLLGIVYKMLYTPYKHKVWMYIGFLPKSIRWTVILYIFYNLNF
jgi:hypothetical protein